MKISTVLLVFLCLFCMSCGNPSPSSNNTSPTLSVSSSRSSLNQVGESVTLTCRTTNATEVSVSGEPTVPTTGLVEIIVTPKSLPIDYIVMASGPSGRSTTNVTITLNILGPQPPSAPAIPIIDNPVSGSGSVSLEWTTVNKGVFATIGYVVFYSTDNTFTKSNSTRLVTTDNSALIEGLTNGTSYYFAVSSIGTTLGGTSFESDLSTKVKSTPSWSIFNRTITAEWTLPTTYSDGTTIAAGDRDRIITIIYMNETGTVPWGSPVATSIAGDNIVTFTAEVVEGTTYYFTGVSTLDGQISNYSTPLTRVF